jgi:GNAT superfamily N-acetyltransferase
MNAPLPAPAWRIIRDKGLGNAWFRCLNVLGYRRLYVLRRPLVEAIPSGPARLPLAIAWLTREDLDAYRSFRAGGNNAARLLAEGDRCLIAWHGSRIVGALWSSTRCARSANLDRDLPLAPGEAFQFNTFTAVAERGQGVASALSAAWLRKMREEGCTAALTLAQPENRAALRTHASVGFRITGMVRSLLLGPWRYHWPIQPVPEATASSIHDGLNHVP